MYVVCNYFAVHLKVTQHCKSTYFNFFKGEGEREHKKKTNPLSSLQTPDPNALTNREPSDMLSDITAASLFSL